MKKKLLLTIALLASTAIFVGCNSAQSEDLGLAQITDSGTIAPLQDLSYDWKDIDIAAGDVSREFSFENSGEEDLILKGAATSCMCTTATFTLPNGEKSPDFGMHGNQKWAYAIKPGEEFSINIVFDPMAHGPNGVGPIQRSIYILSSSVANGKYAESVPDSQDMATEIKVSGNVLSSEEFKEKSAQTGFIFEQTEYDFGVIKQSGGLVSYDFPFTYQGNVPVSITGTPSSCACTEGKVSEKEVKPGESGVVTVVFDPNLHAEPEGKFFKTVSILTEPKLEESAEVKIWVEIDLDLGPEAFKLQEEHNDDHENGQDFHNISPKELKRDLENKDFFLLDVHIPEQEHIEKTDAFIAYDEIENHLSQLPKDKNEKIVIYCRSGSMSLEASQKLIDLGYKNVYNLEGGRNAYVEITQ